MDTPLELLEHPSIESGRLKEHCEWIIQKFEDAIERWFFKRRHQTTIAVRTIYIIVLWVCFFLFQNFFYLNALT